MSVYLTVHVSNHQVSVMRQMSPTQLWAFKSSSPNLLIFSASSQQWKNTRVGGLSEGNTREVWVQENLKIQCIYIYIYCIYIYKYYIYIWVNEIVSFNRLYHCDLWLVIFDNLSIIPHSWIVRPTQNPEICSVMWHHNEISIALK